MLEIVGVSIYHLVMTLFCTGHYGMISLYYRMISASTTNSTYTNKSLVVFVHGRGGHHTNFIGLINNLKSISTNNDEYVTINLGYNRYTSVDTDVAVLKEQLKNFIDCKIVLVGLSKGGLVIMRYITTVDDPRITKAITISSPLMGTKLAWFLPKHSISRIELEYNSQLCQTIAESIAKSPVEVYHVVPEWDNVIIPNTATMYTTTKEENVYIEKGFYGHIGIPFSPDVAKVINKWIS